MFHVCGPNPSTSWGIPRMHERFRINQLSGTEWERSVMRKTDVLAWRTRTGAAFIVPRTRLPSPYSNDIWHPVFGGTRD